MASQVIIIATVALLLASCIAVCAIFVHGSLVEWRERRRGPLRIASVRTICRAASGFEIGEDELQQIRLLTADEAINAVSESASMVDMGDSDVLRLVAKTFALDHQAERLAGSRFWSRKLKGLRLASLLHIDADFSIDAKTDTHPAIRSLAVDLLARRADEESVVQLVQMLKDGNGLIRFAAANALAAIGPSTAPALVDELSDPDHVSLPLVLKVAGVVGDAGIQQLVAPFSSHPAADIREAAVQSLGALGGRQSLEVVVSALSDPAPSVRKVAATALGRTRHWEACPELLRCLEDPDAEVGRAAGEALLAVGASGILMLRSGLGSGGSTTSVCRHMLDVRQAIGATG